MQWGSYAWMSKSVKGPVFGLDDLVWRSTVWAARRPFVMQGLPHFVTMRVDDVTDPPWWVSVANQFGIKPWLGLFSLEMSSSSAATVSTLVNAGQATATVHARRSYGSDLMFYYDHTNHTNFSDATVTQYFDEATAWFQAHQIPIGKFVAPHLYEMGSNVFGRLQGWGVEFIGMHAVPGQPYGSAWLPLGPYRLYETGASDDTSLPVWYADYLSIPGHPEFANTFFACVTEIRDESGYQWLPSNNVADSVLHGTRQVKRAFDSMALATLFTHDYYIQTTSQGNWQSILSGITSNIASDNPRYVTMDYACQYVRATRTSNVSASVYDTVTGNLTTTLTGQADIPTQFYEFTDNGSGIAETLVDVPAFNGSTQVVICGSGGSGGSDTTCDGIDDNCNGQIDEGYVPVPTSCGVGACASTGMSSCVGGAIQGNCVPGTPAASDTTCNGIDENCNRTADEGYVPVPTSCGVGACASTGMSSCVAGAVRDGCVPGTPALEVCDGIDNNCDGTVDNAPSGDWYRDADLDGHGDPTQTIPTCTVGYVSFGDDCNDADPGAFRVPVEVGGLTAARNVEGTLLTWTDQALTAGAGTSYAVVTGFLSTLRTDGGFASATCLGSELDLAEYVDTRRAPPPLDGFYYLVRARNSCGAGTFGDSGLSLDPRDELDTAPPCP